MKKPRKIRCACGEIISKPDLIKHRCESLKPFVQTGFIRQAASQETRASFGKEVGAHG